MNFVSLFSGCGGLDLGFKEAGFWLDLAADCDPVAVQTHRKNLPGKILELDLTEEIPERGGEIDVLIAGPPCQGFSTLGRRDPADPRNELLEIPAEAARRYSPRFFLLENVSGVRAGAHAERLQRSADCLRALGYKVMSVDIEMHAFGVPQQRRRVIQLGWRGPGEFRLSLKPQRTPTLAEVLRKVSGVANHEPVLLGRGSRPGLIARRIKSGQKLCNVRGGPAAVATWTIPEVFGQVSEAETVVLEAMARLRRRNRRRAWGDADPVAARTLSAHLGFASHRHLQRLMRIGYVRRLGDGDYDLTHTFNGKFRRAQASGLSPAVDSRFGDAHYVLHPRAHRAYTVREAARIQGFPDRFHFLGSRRSQYRMVANAVPPPVAHSLAGMIREFLEA